MVVGLGAVKNKAILKTRKLAGDTDVVPVSVISRLSIFVVKKKKKSQRAVIPSPSGKRD